jgi:uncharacterized protein DUF2505
MHLHLEHRIDAALDEVETAAAEEDFQRRLTSLPNVHERRVMSVDERPDGSIHRVVRYVFSGPVPEPVLRVIGAARVSWDEEAEFDPAAHEWRWEIHPHFLGGLFECSGRYACASEGEATNRIVDADIKVKVPLVGGRVERFIADGLTTTLNAEAEMLTQYLRWKREPAS